MITNKPEVFEVYRTRQGALENVVLLADYEALQAECEELRSIISDLRDWDCDVSGGFLSIPVDLRRRMQEAIDAAMQETSHDNQ